MAHIGIFDTGKGGEFVAEQLQKLRPEDTCTVVTDKAHLPYGQRSEQQIIELTNLAIQPLLSSCDVIVLACNTATTVAINRLRRLYPGQRFAGFEPMVKTAATLTKQNKIAILATPATLLSPRYQKLKHEWTEGVHVIEPDCSGWATAIENDSFKTKTAVDLTRQLVTEGVDVISLACTHYLFLQEAMQQAVGSAAVILSPLPAVNVQITRLLATA